jgi:hypothetical protein
MTSNHGPNPSLDDLDLATLEPEIDPDTGIDISLMKCFLAMTVEERWQHHEDAQSFALDLQKGVASFYGQA